MRIFYFMRFLTSIFILTLALMGSLSAQDTSGTEKTYSIDELVITASRTGVRLLESPVSMEIIHREQIQGSGMNMLSEILAIKGGMEIKDYGGTNGAKLLSFRGSTPEQVLVLINGVRANSSASGLTDLGLYDLDNVERIEVYHGGASGLYGSDAVGGVVNIITKKEKPLEKISVGTEVQTSSFDHRRGKIFVQLPLDSWNISAVYVKEYQPDSSYKVNDPNSGSTLTRVNSSTRSDALSLNLERRFEKIDLYWMNRLFSRYAEIPNTIENNSSALAQAKQSDVLVMTNPQISYRYSETLEGNMSMSYAYSKIAYRNGRSRVDDFTKMYTFFSESFLQYHINRSHDMILGFTFSSMSAKGSNIRSSKNTQQSIFAEDKIRFLLSEQFIFNVLQVYPSIRADYYSIYGTVLSPKLGINLSKRQKTTYYAIRASAGKNFRAPTFNERSWFGDGAVGNNEIKPERSVSADAGATFGVESGGGHFFEWNASIYRIKTHDQIVWQLGAIEPSLWSPLNVASTLTRGAEVTMNHRYKNFLNSEINYTFNRALNISDKHRAYRLRYSPLYSLKMANELSFHHFSFSQNTRYVSERFVSVDNTAYLKPYWITDAFISHYFKLPHVMIKTGIGINNLFDAAYETVALYPGTAREYIFTVGINY